MWSVGKRGVATVYVGQQEIRLAHRDEERVLARGVSLEQSMAALNEALLPLGRAPLRVLASAAWCQPLLLPAVEGVKNEAEWQRIAAGMVEPMTGLPADSRLWLDTKQAPPIVAVALHPLLGTALDELGKTHRLQEVRPWWAAALANPDDAALRSGATLGLAVIDSDALTLLLAQNDRYEVAQSYLLMGDDPRSVLARALVSQGRQVQDVVVRRLSGTETGVNVNAEHGTQAASAEGSALPAPSASKSLPFLEVFA